MDVDFFEMCSLGLNHLDVREPDRNIVGQSDPETSLALSPFEDVRACRLIQDGLGRVSLEKSRGASSIADSRERSSRRAAVILYVGVRHATLLRLRP